MTPIVVVHDVRDSGGPWRDALRGWPDDASAPDLVVDGASGDRTDVVWLLLEQMEALRDRNPIIVGCGEHSLAAETFALAGWAGGLVLVDGLGGSWTTAQQQVEAQRDWLRAAFVDRSSVTYPLVWVESFTRSMRSHIRCPVLVIETPASITPDGEADSRAQDYAGSAQVVRLGAAAPQQVVPAIRAWVGS